MEGEVRQDGITVVVEDEELCEDGENKETVWLISEAAWATELR